MQQFLIEADAGKVTEYLEQEVLEELNEEYGEVLKGRNTGLAAALNMFWEYSMTNQYAFVEYTGFNEDEVKALCRRFDMDFDKTSSWYDGYRENAWW